MRLIRCHIEGFGAFSKQDFAFDAHFTEFCQKNGWGKTTLCDFLTAMLYGLATSRGNSGFDKRQRYFPFDGGRFGGNLVLEVDGKEWRIERFFDVKSETKDTLTVYCDGDEVPFARGEVGLRLLGVDAATFARVSLVGDEQLGVGSNKELGARLQATLDATPDEVKYEQIEDALKELIQKLKPAKKSAKNPGKIPSLKEHISELETKLKGLRATADALPAHYAEYHEMQAKIAELEARLAAVGAYDLRRQKWETYQGYLQDAAHAKEEIGTLTAKYPEGFPSLDEIECLKDLEKERIGLDARFARVTIFGDRARLESLRATYPQGLPDADALAEAKEQLAHYERAINERAFMERERIASPDEETKNLFAFGTPSAEELAEMEALVKEIGVLDEKLQASAEAKNTLTQEKKPTGLIGILFGGTALFAVLGGILAPTILPLGIALFALAVGALIWGVALAAKQNKPGSGLDASLALQTEKNERLNALRTHLIAYRLGASPLADYSRLLSSLETYLRVKEQEKAREARVLENEAQRKAAEEALVAFIGRYCTPSENLRGDIEKLEKDGTELAHLEKSEKEQCDEKRDLAASLQNTLKEIAAILARYQLGVPASLADCIEELQRDVTSYQEVQRKCEELHQRAQQYRRDEALSEEPTPVEGDVDALRAEIAAQNKLLADKARDIETYEQETRDLVEWEETLAQERQTLAELEEQLDILSLTRDLIEQAEKNIVERYVGPVRKTLGEYLDKVKLVLGENLALNKEFELQFEAGGELRPEGHLSAGQRAICGLCFRLAMLPHLYGDAAPFVILDDPFAVVDDAYIEKLRVLVKELSQNTQIVYFCCHESRSMK
jgi:DNA repair exonuclease SbcCD ATPase subunit